MIRPCQKLSLLNDKRILGRSTEGVLPAAVAYATRYQMADSAVM